MPQYICRVCDNSADWVRPANSATETKFSHFGNFSFGYEEWNFCPQLLIDGWQYGWIEGFNPGPGKRLVAPGSHQVLLYVRRNGKALAVGRLLVCEKLFPSSRLPAYPPILAHQARTVGAAITVVGSTWNISPTVARPRMQAYSQVPHPNMRFKPEDAVLFAAPMPLPISYTRYGALLVTPTNGRLPIWSSVP